MMYIPKPLPQAISEPKSQRDPVMQPTWSPALQNLLDQPPARLPWHLAAAGLLFACAFGTWAWFGQVKEVSRAPGLLIPKGKIYKVQPIAQAGISRLLVQEGQTVKAGQVMAELDHRLATTEIAGLQDSLNADRLQWVQIQGLVEKTQLEIQAQQVIATAQMQSQVAAIAEAETDAHTHRQLLQDLSAEMTAYQNRLDRLQPLVNEGAISQDHLFTAEQELRQRQQTATQNQGDLQKALVSIQQLQAKLTQAEAEGQRNILAGQQKIQQLNIQAQQLQAKMAATANAIKAAKTKLEDAFIYAPVSGVVTDLKVNNIGEMTQPGQTFAEIMPGGATLVLSANLPNSEAGFVQKGMPVQIKFNAFPYQRYGTIPGKVIFIAPDATVDEEMGSVYRVEIALNQSAIHQGEQQIPLKAGQTATAEVVTHQRRIIDILLEPIKQIQKVGIDL